MQRPGAVIGDVVGDVDERVDRSQADRLQPVLQPSGARPVLDVPRYATGEHRTGRGALPVEVEFNRHGIGEAAFDRLDRVLLELTKAGRGEVAGDAAHAEAIWPVRRDGDFDHRIVETERRGGRAADLCVGVELDDAGVLVGQLELAL